VLCPWDSERRKRKLAGLRRLARSATAAEPVFYEDEMDVHLNPKIGRNWMLPGHRRYVVTPGQNRKRFVAGAVERQDQEADLGRCPDQGERPLLQSAPARYSTTRRKRSRATPSPQFDPALRHQVRGTGRGVGDSVS
jgi:hypothetical protein